MALPSHFFCLVFECVINSLVYLSLFSCPIWRFSKLNTFRLAGIALCSILFFLQLVLHFFGQVGLPILLPKWATRLHLRPCEQLLLLHFSFLQVSQIYAASFSFLPVSILHVLFRRRLSACAAVYPFLIVYQDHVFLCSLRNDESFKQNFVFFGQGVLSQIKVKFIDLSHLQTSPASDSSAACHGLSAFARLCLLFLSCRRARCCPQSRPASTVYK